MNSQKNKPSDLGTEPQYGNDFYENITDGSLTSGLIYAGILQKIMQPQTVADLGCGRGAWLKAFKEQGASRLVGYDGSWVSQTDMIDQSISFSAIDLNDPDLFSAIADRFDLAISLEVAEHLEPTSANNFVRSLTSLSDVVLFSAAYTKQGGNNHINEQPHSYWAKHFADFGYAPYDLFRPVVWGNSDVPFWYQQNAFLYAKSGSEPAKQLAATGHLPMSNVSFMDCVHPQLFEIRTRLKTKKMIKELVSRAFGKRRDQ